MPEAARIRKILIATRLTIGMGALIAPRLTGRIFGLDPASNRQLPLLGRLFGVRDALMAYQLYQASDEELEEVLRQGILVDGVDLLTAVGAMVRGEISARAFVSLVLGAGGAIAAGVLARQP